MQTFTRHDVARALHMEDDCDGYTLLDASPWHGLAGSQAEHKTNVRTAF
jgi:hypothetical protein